MEDSISYDRYRAQGYGEGGVRPTKACVECRRQKMKCEPAHGGPCRRCRNSKIECVFKPRANARQPTATVSPKALPPHGSSPPEVLARLAAIEAVLGMNGNNHPISPSSGTVISTSPVNTTNAEEEDQGDPTLGGLWPAVEFLRRRNVSATNRIWSRSVVSQLWLSFYTNMEGLHFQSESEAFKNPTPLLLVATLYVSALHHTSAELAALAPEYFRAACSAIMELSVPESLAQSSTYSPGGSVPLLTVEQKAFQNVLGLILAGLVSEAFVDMTGIWISIGYRLILDHCPVYIDQSANKWRQLFSGLQIIDLEHASLHLSCTIVPIQAPLPSLRQLQCYTEDPFNRLTVMMHNGLSHFAGRGLPTIWSVMSSNQSEVGVAPVFPFTDRDAQVIKEWARSLDDWLVSSNRPTNTGYDGIQIRRQYNLHRLFVLSIYHPARGFDLFAASVALSERHELLLSARATLMLRRDDKGIWANWDLVMITWAAILVLQGAQGGVGEHEDLSLVQDHLEELRKTKRPAPSLHHMLADRLETWLQSVNLSPNLNLTQPVFDPSWSLFDQNSIQIASGSMFQQTALDAGSDLDNPSITGQTDADAMAHQQQQNYDDPGFWNVYGNHSASWPSNLTRIFGNTAFSDTADNEGGS
ncbi:hypothetical protein HBI56_079290 [Parastagonospora nodorum]|nr:hypothetical protein HBH53_056910 [Parastagonospora nodorum]KAH3975304.1 hypothetical protein HBH52_129850 [Parastagonospora nodorum]KAH3978913.1 hypothetical protein HBH51_066810 [Parastagonospora nodorum]KAH3999023.1 hypothetical protein HBI10_123260 [Parastagonospora nodorum]KAH4017147.1 hypothetical protein HBI09_197490 [Parastagonospora nodorum]